MLSFRKMTEQDLPCVMAIESGAGPNPWKEKNYLDSLQSGYLCAIAELDGETVGQAVVMCAGGEASLLIITIDQQHQGKGFGHQLMKHLIEQASKQAETLFLEVRISNKAAFHLYLNEGFSEIGRRRNYYPATAERKAEDAIVMALDLSTQE